MTQPVLLLGRPLTSWWRLASQFLRYAILGGCGAMVDVLVFALLTHISQAPTVLVNVVSVLCGIVTSFVLNARWTFDHRGRWRWRLLKFLVVGLSGLMGSTALLWVLIQLVGVAPLEAKLLTLPPVALGQFVANRWWTFSPAPQSTGHRMTAQDA